MIDTGSKISDKIHGRVIKMIWESIWDRDRSMGGGRICASVWERVNAMIWDRGWNLFEGRVWDKYTDEEWDNLLEAE